MVSSLSCNIGACTRDEILQKCKSNDLRRKLLEEGAGLTLARTLELAQQCEKVGAQMASLSLQSTQHSSSNDHPVNRIAPTTNSRDQRPRNLRRPSVIPQKESTCYRCGKTGHYSRDPSCPARARPVATVVVPITLLLYANHSRVPPAECTLSTRCQVMNPRMSPPLHSI